MDILKLIRAPQIVGSKIDTAGLRKGLAWYAKQLLIFVALVGLLGILIDVSQTDVMKAAMVFAAVAGLACTANIFMAKEKAAKLFSIVLAVVFGYWFLVFALG